MLVPPSGRGSATSKPTRQCGWAGSWAVRRARSLRRSPNTSSSTGSARLPWWLGASSTSGWTTGGSRHRRARCPATNGSACRATPPPRRSWSSTPAEPRQGDARRPLAVDDHRRRAGAASRLPRPPRHPPQPPRRLGHPGRQLPTRELGCGSGVTCWRRLRDWQHAGVWEALHHRLLDWLGDDGQVDWSRTAIDSVSVRARRGGTSLAQTRSTGASQDPSTIW
jgi:hypothetical protein